MVSFAMQEAFSLMKSYLFIFAFVAFVFGVRLKKIIAKTYVKELTTYVFFCEFYGFRSYMEVIHFELIFVSGVR